MRDTFPPHEVARRLKSFPAYMFRLDGNLYGRRTAGSVCRDELEEILVEKMKPTFCFVRGKHDPCTYHCSSSKVTLVYHVDDVRCSGPASALNRLIDVELPKHCEIQAGPLEAEGVAVEVLGRVKTRLEGAILTAPDPKHAKNILTALDIQPKEKSAVHRVSSTWMRTSHWPMNLPNGTDWLWAVVYISRQIEEILPTQSKSWLAIWHNRGCAIGKMLWSWVGILIATQIWCEQPCLMATPINTSPLSCTATMTGQDVQRPDDPQMPMWAILGVR